MRGFSSIIAYRRSPVRCVSGRELLYLESCDRTDRYFPRVEAPARLSNRDRAFCRSSCHYFVILFSDLSPDVCTILAADSRPPTSEHSVSLTLCQRHDRRVLNALFDDRSAIEVCHAVVVDLEASQTFAHAFGPHRKHHVCIVAPRNRHVVSHRPFWESLLIQVTWLLQRLSCRWFLRVSRTCNISGP